MLSAYTLTYSTWGKLLGLLAFAAMSSVVTLGVVALRSGHESARRLGQLAAVSLASAVVWLVLDRAFELHIIWRFDASHGMSAGDLFALVPLATAGLLLRRRRRR